MTREQRRKLLRFIQSLEKPEQFFQAHRFALAIGEKGLSAELMQAYTRVTTYGLLPKFRLDSCRSCGKYNIHDILCPMER